MKFNQILKTGKIIKRYKRFFVDFYLDENCLGDFNNSATNLATAHTANTGSMKTCIGENWQGAFSFHDDPKRKLKYSLELTHNSLTWIGVNTSLTNKLAIEAIGNGTIKELSGYQNLKPEATIGKSRIDILLSNANDQDQCYVEVKNVSMKIDNELAIFPDAVTERGSKHLLELIQIKKSGLRACMLFIIQRDDVEYFRPAFEIDPIYASNLKMAIDSGVEVYIYKCKVSLEEIMVYKRVPLID